MYWPLSLQLRSLGFYLSVQTGDASWNPYLQGVACFPCHESCGICSASTIIDCIYNDKVCSSSSLGEKIQFCLPKKPLGEKREGRRRRRRSSSSFSRKLQSDWTDARYDYKGYKNVKDRPRLAALLNSIWGNDLRVKLTLSHSTGL